jgi:hypothetical protein
MENQIYKLRRVVFSLLELKAIIVGMAALNFAVIYVEAERAAGLSLCWGGPWYVFEQYSNYPLLLLVAAIGLYLGRWWGNLIAVIFSTPILFGGVTALMSPDGLLSWYWYPTSLLFQYIFAVMLFSYGIAAVGQSGLRRRATAL